MPIIYDAAGVTSHSDSSTAQGGRSVAAEEYRYWRQQRHLRHDEQGRQVIDMGCRRYSHIEARNKMIDYVRRYTSREVTEHTTFDLSQFGISLQGREFDMDCFAATGPDVEAIVEFNQLFERALRLARQLQLKQLLCFVVRYEGLEHQLSLANRDMVDLLIGDQCPESIADMSRMMGFRMRPRSGTAADGHDWQRISVAFIRWQKELRALMRQAGFDLAPT